MCSIERNLASSYMDRFPYVLCGIDGDVPLRTNELASLVSSGAASLLSGRTEGHQRDGSLYIDGMTVRRTEDGGVSFYRVVHTFTRDEARALLFWLAKEFATDEEAEA